MGPCSPDVGIAIWVAQLQSHSLLLIRGGFCKVASTSGIHIDNLLASPGAIIYAQGELITIPTLVPARAVDGACRFLKEGRCSIHAVSPFNCAFFGHEQSREEADALSMRGLVEIAKAWQRGDLYARLWIMLHEAGRIAPSPLVARARMRAALDAG